MPSSELRASAVPSVRRCLLAVVALATAVVGLVVLPAAALPDNVARLDAADAVAAGVAVSQEVFPVTADAVVLATDANFPDALAASAVAGAFGGPVLFTAPDALSQPTADEVNRLLTAGDTVYVMGGESAVGPAVQARLESDGYIVQRLAGETRIETAAAAARLVGVPAGGEVIVARAFGPGGAGSDSDKTTGWVDAVSCGGYAADQSVPVLLTETSRLSDATAQVLNDLDPADVVVCGGTAAVDSSVEATIAATGSAVRRISGPTRVETAVAAARQLFGYDTAAGHSFVLVNGYDQNFGFGLAAAPFAAARDAAILLVGTDEPTDCDATGQPSRETLCYLETAAGAGGADLTVVGGIAFVADAVGDAAGAAAGESTSASPSPSGSPTTSPTATPTGTASPTPTPTPARIPDKVAGVVATDDQNDDGTRLTVKWTANADPDGSLSGYNVYRGTGGTATELVATVGKGILTFVLEGLTTGTAYTVQVEAFNSGNVKGPRSDGAQGTPANEAPLAVKDFKAQPGDGRAILRWTASPELDVEKYTVTRLSNGTACNNSTPDTAFDTPQDVGGRTTTTLEVTGLANGTTYCFRIVARDKSQVSGPATAAPVTPNVGQPVVTLVTPEDGSTLHFGAPYKISWTVQDSNDPVENLEIILQFSANGGTSYTDITPAGHKHPGAAPEGNFTWNAVPDTDVPDGVIRITALDPGNRFGTDSRDISTARKPAVVAGLTATSGANKVDLLWDANIESTVTGYEIQRKEVQVPADRSDAAACGQDTGYTANYATVPQGASKRMYTDTAVTSAATPMDRLYCYKVRALRGAMGPHGDLSPVVRANPTTTGAAPVADVSISDPASGTLVRSGRAFTIRGTIAVPEGGTVPKRVDLSYCVNYNPGTLGIGEGCDDAPAGTGPGGFTKIVSLGVSAPGEFSFPNATVPAGTDSTTGAIRADLYNDTAETAPSVRNTINTPITFR